MARSADYVRTDEGQQAPDLGERAQETRPTASSTSGSEKSESPAGGAAWLLGGHGVRSLRRELV
ncbi:MAG: hypothetical protein JWO62_565, partial [Acidimicrobiaceae bacterium]|nr:hypothetical protein [Acidimicrobiaceae bacterium]